MRHDFVGFLVAVAGGAAISRDLRRTVPIEGISEFRFGGCALLLVELRVTMLPLLGIPLFTSVWPSASGVELAVDIEFKSGLSA